MFAKIEAWLERQEQWFLPLFLCLVWGAFRLAGFEGVFGQDSYEYARYARDLALYWKGGTTPAPCHFPIFYPLIASFLATFLPFLLAMQALSLFSLYGVYIFTKKILLHFWKDLPYVRLYLFSFGILSTYFLRLGLCSLSDMLAMLGTLAAFYFLLQTEKKGYLFLAALASAVAILTRYGAAFVLILPWLLWAWAERKRLFRLELLLSVGASFALFALVFYLKGNYQTELLGHPGTTDWKLSYFFQRDFDFEAEGKNHYLLPGILFHTLNFLHPGYILIGVLLCFFVRKEDWTKRGTLMQNPLLYILLAIAPYLFFLMGYPTQNVRHQTFIFPFLLILFAPAFPRFLSFFTQKIPNSKIQIGFFIFILLLQTGLFIKGTKAIRSAAIKEKNIVKSILSLPPASAIYTIQIEGALDVHGLKTPFETIFQHKIERFKNNSLFLLPANIHTQWQGREPEQNWLKVKAEYNIRQENLNLPDGWQLWRIESLKQ